MPFCRAPRSDVNACQPCALVAGVARYFDYKSRVKQFHRASSVFADRCCWSEDRFKLQAVESRLGENGRHRATSGGGQLITMRYRYDNKLTTARCRPFSPRPLSAPRNLSRPLVWAQDPLSSNLSLSAWKMMTSGLENIYPW